jgi:hypothetical protein
MEFDPVTPWEMKRVDDINMRGVTEALRIVPTRFPDASVIRREMVSTPGFGYREERRDFESLNDEQELRSNSKGECIMRKFSFAFNILAITVFSLAISSAAQAQATRTWVSGVGDDANPCSRTAPCKTFAGAISKTAPCGEISVLDPGGFGAVTITKGITLNGDGTLAGILNATVNGIIVNAQPGDAVTIRNISINGAGSGVNGIRYLAGKSVNVDSCSISGFTGNGIDVSVGASGTNNLMVRKTAITGNCSGSPIGIRMTTTGATLCASIDSSYLQGLASGLDVLSGTATITRSVASNNSNFGIVAEGGVVNADTNYVTCNGTGVAALGVATLRLSNNTITGNTTGIVATGTVNTFGDNKNLGNTTPGAPNQAVTTKQ